MRLLRRILLTVVITLTFIFVGVRWVAPVSLSFYTATKVPPVARIVPRDLKDKFGFERGGEKKYCISATSLRFRNDLDETQSKFHPKDIPDKFKVLLHFRSGLQMSVSAVPPQSWAAELATDFKVPRQTIESWFEAKSDYRFLKNLYEFTPEKMHYWAWSEPVHYREMMLLTIKSISLLKEADTGIFNVQNQEYRGFQQGDPQARQDRIAIDLFSDDGGVEMIFFQTDYRNSAGVTQPEINRIVESSCKTAGNEAVATNLVKKVTVKKFWS